MDKKEKLIKDRKKEINGRKKIIKVVLLLKNIEVTDKELEFLIKVNEKATEGVFHSTKIAKEEIAKELEISEIYVSKMLQKFSSINILTMVKKGFYRVDEKIKYALTWDDLYIRISGDTFSII